MLALHKNISEKKIPSKYEQQIELFQKTLRAWKQSAQGDDPKVFIDHTDPNANIFMRIFEFNLAGLIPPSVSPAPNEHILSNGKRFVGKSVDSGGFKEPSELDHFEQNCLAFFDKIIKPVQVRALLDSKLKTCSELSVFFRKFSLGLYREIIKNPGHATPPTIKKNIYKLFVGNFYHRGNNFTLNCEELGLSLNFQI